MRKFVLFLALASTLSLFSCKREYIELTIGEIEVIDDGISLIGNSFVLTSGNIYLENMDNGDKTMYTHFDSNKTLSGMRMGNFEYPLERLEVNITTWSFRTNGHIGEFILDGDSLNPYGIDGSYGQFTIYEHTNASTSGPISIKMGGSSKPFQTSSEGDEITVYIHEAYTTINGVQYTYFNELTFQLVN